MLVKSYEAYKKMLVKHHDEAMSKVSDLQYHYEVSDEESRKFMKVLMVHTIELQTKIAIAEYEIERLEKKTEMKEINLTKELEHLSRELEKLFS